jgi:hypothetical protein
MISNQNAQACRQLIRWVCFISSLLGLFAAGCASQNVDPAKPHAHTGYIDFVAEDDDLSWQVDRLDKTDKPKEVFVQYSPLNDRILRLAFAPGQYQLRVTFLNRVVKEPGVVDVEVKAGTISPVRVSFDELGATLMSTRSTQASGTFYGRFGRATRLRENEVMKYRVKLEREQDVPYVIKKETPYAKAPGK